MPHFQGQLEPTQASYDWIVGTDYQFVGADASTAIDKSRAEYAGRARRAGAGPLAGEPASS